MEMNNIILYADELADAARKAGGDYNTIHQTISAEAKKNHPMYLGMIAAVNYDSKTDRHVIKFDHGTLRVTNEVAEFLLVEAFNKTMKPTVTAHMTAGTVDGVCLLFIGR